STPPCRSLLRAEVHLEGVAGIALGVDVRLRAAAAALVGNDDGRVDQLVLGDDRLDGAREDVRAAARPRRGDEFDRPLGLPLLRLDRARGQYRAGQQAGGPR